MLRDFQNGRARTGRIKVLKSHDLLSEINTNRRDFPGGPVVKTPPSSAGVGVQSLVGDLRYPSGVAKRLKINKCINKTNGRNKRDGAG